MEGRTGEISEWNEGNLKSLRLHEAQEMINFAKINPLVRSPDGRLWNYENWISGIDILFGEGGAKYNSTELKEVNQIKNIVEFVKINKPVYKIVVDGNQKQQSVLNYQNWEQLKKLIEIYEPLVKLYNDKHGLSTRNVGTGGLF